MKRIFALMGITLLLLLSGAASAQAGGCYDRDNCQDRCRPVDCCQQKVCWPIYRWETRKVFDGYRYDCNECRHPVYRYVRVKVYVGKRCTYRNGGNRDRDDAYDNDAYRQEQPSYSRAPEYTGADQAFPHYEGNY